MKVLIMAALIFIFSGNALADNDITFFKNETLETCYNKRMSPAVQNCMIYLSDKKKQDYEKEFKLLVKKAQESKNEFHNYNEFMKSIKSSKKNWDSYIKEECLAQAYLDENDSFAFHTDRNVCLIKGYSERITFYKNYQF